MKTLVVFYSRGGSNKYLAQRFASEFNSDIIELKPRVKGFFWQLIFSAMKINFGVKKNNVCLSNYDKVIVCGPIWMGQLASPIRAFLKKNKKDIKAIYFATSCGISDAEKESNFGYIKVFKEVQNLMGSKLCSSEAFSISLVMTDEEKKDSGSAIRIAFNDINFVGEVKKRFDDFVKIIRQ